MCEDVVYGLVMGHAHRGNFIFERKRFRILPLEIYVKVHMWSLYTFEKTNGLITNIEINSFRTNRFSQHAN